MGDGVECSCKVQAEDSLGCPPRSKSRVNNMVLDLEHNILGGQVRAKAKHGGWKEMCPFGKTS